MQSPDSQPSMFHVFPLGHKGCSYAIDSITPKLMQCIAYKQSSFFFRIAVIGVLDLLSNVRNLSRTTLPYSRMCRSVTNGTSHTRICPFADGYSASPQVVYEVLHHVYAAEFLKVLHRFIQVLFKRGSFSPYS